MGLLDGFADFIKTPEGQGLLSGAFGMAAGAKRGAPWNTLGRGGMAGLAGYSGALDRQEKASENEQMQKYRGLQQEQFKLQIDQAKAAQEAARRKAEVMQGLFTGGSIGMPATMGDPQTGILPNPAVPASAPSIDLGKAMSSGLFSPEELLKLDSLRNLGKNEVARTIVSVQNGREVEQQFDKFGNPVNQGMEKYRAPLQIDSGGKIEFRNPFDPSKMISEVMKSQTPDSVASNFTAQRGQNMTSATAAAGRAQSDRHFNSRMQFDNALGGKPPPGYRYTSDGSSLEAIPGGPADMKAKAEADRKASGGSDVEVSISTLRDAYDRLDRGGGITSTNKGMMSNMAAAASSSGLGQSVGKALGTDNQSARNDIAMSRPALLAALMKATGMSAKQMDSNAELKLWLATATDPTLDVESNRRALQNIEKKYISASPAKQTASSNGKNSVTVDGKPYMRPSNMSEAQWSEYKKAMGVSE